ncbi:MAG: ribosome recycling factor [Bacillota bacterium]|uniref:Ribosome-recycling factor n=1 Tax=[Clostridium] aminophilum TaxID=1526 RepID=A0A1I6JJD7_9FIRM|nr:ribosome recycling factor [[Clostridium] aminophilum]MCR4629420.1 ribosome recycling factor [Clostridium sp.]MDT3843350.1 ribosome recycling factor [Bacillota bacterium]SET00367.1 ribosome recycling factor [[Clostridium] aminophilum]SFR79136.1 ribosome recycling factor [[Clostridium] aminophilum]
MHDRLKVFEEKMNKSYDAMLSDFSAIRAGRANPHVLDHIKVDYYGSPTPLQGVANITVPEARIIQIAPWDKKMVKDIEKAILTSDLGINPNNDGSVIRLVFPELTEERRKDLAKDVKKLGEGCKVAIRNIRRDGMELVKKLQKNGEISEDEQTNDETDIQELTDKMIKMVDKAVETKNKEIMTV